MRCCVYAPGERIPRNIGRTALDDALEAASGSSIGDQRPAGERQIDAGGAQVVARAQARGLNAATLSIDDVYLTRAQRQRLARQVHPLLITAARPATPTCRWPMRY